MFLLFSSFLCRFLFRFFTFFPSYRGGDPFEIGIMGPAQLVSLKDNDNGSYTCAVEVLTPPTSASGNTMVFSTIMIMITLYGKPIQGSPFKPVLYEPSATSGSHHVAPSSSSRRAGASVPTSSPFGKGKNSTTGGGETHAASASLPSSLNRNDETTVQAKTPVRTVPTAAKPSSSSSTPPSVSSLGATSRPNTANGARPSQSQQQLQSQPQQQHPVGRQSQIQSSPLPSAKPYDEAMLDALIPSNLSRLERSRQRALLAKSLAENNSNGVPRGFPVSPSPPIPNSSDTFGIPLDSLRDGGSEGRGNQREEGNVMFSNSQQQMQQSQQLGTPATSAMNRGKLSQLAQRNAASLQALKLSSLNSTGMEINNQSNRNGYEMSSAVDNRNPVVSAAAGLGGGGGGSNGVNKPRNNFLTELAMNLKQGLGHMNQSLSSSSTAVEIELWENTNRGITDDKVASQRYAFLPASFSSYFFFPFL
jgi:hypothetical protein